MKWILVGVCLVIGIAEIHTSMVLSTGAAGERCRAGSKWTSPCFDCACSEEGKPVCKRRSCADAAEAKDVWECEPRTSWKNDCNWCHCSDNGRPLCTRRGCEAPLPPQTHPIQDKGSNSECKPDTAWTTDDCSSCKCINGKSVCTKITCNGKNDKATEPTVTVAVSSTSPQPTAAPAVDEATVSPVGRECAIGTRWESQCGNTCVCSPSGYGACTEKGCEGYDAAKDFKCKPESTWSDDCNTCFCTFDGKPACTRVACDGQAIKIPEINFGGGDKEISSSTEANLLVQNLEVEVVDEPASKAPTRVKRQEKPELQTSPTKVCDPKSKFRLDCNTCLCDKRGSNFSCTRLDCSNGAANNAKRRRREVRSQKKKCEPGSVFTQACNVCRCATDGQHATCTRNRCPTLQDITDKQVSTTETGFRCTPGEQFKRSCNDCTCSADGKSVFCTIKLCENEIVSQL